VKLKFLTCAGTPGACKSFDLYDSWLSFKFRVTNHESIFSVVDSIKRERQLGSKGSKLQLHLGQLFTWQGSYR
jgi:hypothetical protein